MKLGDILISRTSWRQLGLLEIPPSVSFQIFEYDEALEQKREVIEKKRRSIIERKEKEQGDGKPLSKESALYLAAEKEYQDFLNTDCAIEPFPMTLQALNEIIKQAPVNKTPPDMYKGLKLFFKAAEIIKEAVKA